MSDCKTSGRLAMPIDKSEIKKGLFMVGGECRGQLVEKRADRADPELTSLRLERQRDEIAERIAKAKQRVDEVLAAVRRQ